MKMWVFKELSIQYLEEHLAYGERHLKRGIKGKSVLARLTGRDGGDLLLVGKASRT